MEQHSSPGSVLGIHRLGPFRVLADGVPVEESRRAGPAVDLEAAPQPRLYYEICAGLLRADHARGQLIERTVLVGWR